MSTRLSTDRKGWFRIPGVQDGDRDLADQLKGLEDIDFAGAHVLDLGCAEGLIANYALEKGAELVHGIEIVPGHVETARRICAQWGERVKFWHMDLHNFVPRGTPTAATDEFLAHYDIVLALAILHKLRWPFWLLYATAPLKADLWVVRLPAKGDGVIVDRRSGELPYDVPRWFEQNGYVMTREHRGYLDEWCGYFEIRR